MSCLWEQSCIFFSKRGRVYWFLKFHIDFQKSGASFILPCFWETPLKGFIPLIKYASSYTVPHSRNCIEFEDGFAVTTDSQQQQQLWRFPLFSLFSCLSLCSFPHLCESAALAWRNTAPYWALLFTANKWFRMASGFSEGTVSVGKSVFALSARWENTHMVDRQLVNTLKGGGW